jgi:hypothetical protein
MIKVVSDKGVSELEIERSSRDNGLAFSWSSIPYSSSANDTILIVKNTSSTQKLYITDVNINVGATASRLDVHLVTSDYSSAGTAVTGVNLNTGSSNSAILKYVYCAVDTHTPLDLRGVILIEDDALGVDIIENSISEVSVTITGYYR